MATQKAIAKWIGDGRTLDFERFAIKTPQKILAQCLELNRDLLRISGQTLKKFEKFVIYTTNPDGTNEVPVMELTDNEYLSLLKKAYMDYHHGVAPEERDGDVWATVMSGHSFRESAQKYVADDGIDFVQKRIDSLSKVIKNNESYDYDTMVSFCGMALQNLVDKNVVSLATARKYRKEINDMFFNAGTYLSGEKFDSIPVCEYLLNIFKSIMNRISKKITESKKSFKESRTRLDYGQDVIDILEKYGFKKCAVDVEDDLVTYMYSVAQTLRPQTPYIEFTVNGDDALVDGMYYTNGRKGYGVQFDTKEDVLYFIENAEYGKADLIN